MLAERNRRRGTTCIMLYFVFLLFLLASGLALTNSALALSCDVSPTLPAAVESDAWLRVAAANTSSWDLSGMRSTLWVQQQIRLDNATARALLLTGPVALSLGITMIYLI